MFSPDHFLWIGICIVLILLLTFLSTKFKWSFKTSTTVILVTYILVEIFKIATHVEPASRWLGEGATIDNFEGAMYLNPKSMPFQICSSMIFFVFYLRFGKDEKKLDVIKSFVGLVFLTAAILAIIFGTCLSASNTANFLDSFKDPDCGPIQFFLYHSIMVWYGIYLAQTKQIKTGIKQFRTNLIILGVMLVVGIWINSFLIIYETNYMFVVAPPAKGIPLLNLDNGWVVYMIHYILLEVLVVLIFELPGIIKELKQKNFKTS